MTQTKPHTLESIRCSACPRCHGTGRACEREPLTPRQKEALEAITFSIRVGGSSPSLSRLAKKLDLRSLASVHELVHELERKGYVHILPKQAYGIRLTD